MAFELIKVSELPELTTPSDPNVIPIQDGDYLKRISIQNLKKSLTGDIAGDLDAEVEAREQAVSDEAQARENADDAILADLAAEYDATATYAVGDYCIHEGQLQRCIVPIETAEAWTAAHWSAVALGDDVSDLKNALTQMLSYGGVDTFLDLDWEQGDINSQTGAVMPSVAWYHTRLIPSREINGATYKNTSGASHTLYTFEYYSDGSYYRRLSDTSIGVDGNYTVPSDRITDGNYARFVLGYNRYAYSSFENIVQTIATLEDVDALRANFKVVLPTDIYVVAGTEMNIYTDNVILGNYEQYAVSWQFTQNYSWANQFDECFRINPTASDIGDYNLHFILNNKITFGRILLKRINLHIIADTVRTGKKVLFIGDSLTNAGYYPYEIQHNLSNGGVTSIGTITSHPYFDEVAVSVNAEGRGGWSAKDYVTKSSSGDVINAFWNPSSQKFDFGYYLSNNSFTVPDIIFLNLGTNGVEDADGEVNAIKEMITSIRTSSSTVPIVISLITPPATQNGWTTSSHGGSVNVFKRLELLLVERYMEEFNGILSDVYVAPAYINLDTKHDFPYSMVAVSSRNPYEVYRQTNNVHPSNYGYFKMADVYWGMIQHLLT